MVVIAAKIGLTGSDINILDPTWDPFIVTEAIGYSVYEAWLVWGMCSKGNTVMTLLSGVITSGIAEELEPMTEPQEGQFRPLLQS